MGTMGIFLIMGNAGFISSTVSYAPRLYFTYSLGFQAVPHKTLQHLNLWQPFSLILPRCVHPNPKLQTAFFLRNLAFAVRIRKPCYAL